MTPSDLSWWVWLLVAAGCWVLWFMVDSYLDDAPERGVGLSRLIRFLSFVGCLLAAIIGVIRFVKWIWVG